jgi:hypothetical protein
MLAVVLLTLFISKTLSANIRINSGTPIEFGQGLAQTAACSGSTSLIIKPIGSFTNSSGNTGTFYFSSFSLSNIPVSCQGKDFTIRAYGNTSGSAAVALFNSSSTDAIIYNNSGTYQLGTGVSGASVTTDSSSQFTFTFTTPVATANSIYKLTIESTPHTAPAALLYALGDTGPGGGKIFYTDINGFACGPTLALTCNYLEAAPNNWNGSSPEPQLFWAITALNGTSIGVNAQGTAIGTGYKNSVAIVNQGNDNTTAAGAARAYTGGSKSDWYLPSQGELSTLSTNRSYVSSFLTNEFYWTSTEYSSSVAWGIYVTTGQQTTSIGKFTYQYRYVRPIRSF